MAPAAQQIQVLCPGDKGPGSVFALALISTAYQRISRGTADFTKVQVMVRLALVALSVAAVLGPFCHKCFWYYFLEVLFLGGSPK